MADAKKAKRKAIKKGPLNMTFEEAIRLSTHTKIPKEVVKKGKK